MILDKLDGILVAPLVGAWIESIRTYNVIRCAYVAPLVGAWIES